MEKVIEKKGLSFWTENFGSPSSPAVLLIAGAGSPALFWSDTFCQQLADQGFYLIRYDHRDTGLSSQSDFTNNPYTLDDLTEDIFLILEGYSISKIHLIGHSMGACIAQIAAAFHAKEVLSLVLIAPPPAGLSQVIPEPMGKAERDRLTETWKIMLENKPTLSYEESLEGFIKVWTHLNGDYPLDRELAQHFLKDLYTRSHSKVGEHKNHMMVMQNYSKKLQERTTLFQKIICPTLIIQGEKDVLIEPHRGGKFLSQSLPKAKYISLPKMGHMLFNRELENKLIELIADFYKKIVLLPK